MQLDLIGSGIVTEGNRLFAQLNELDHAMKIEVINELRKCLHEYSPLKDEPVDCVLWINADLVEGNDYNPNSVAPPEMKLLERSIAEDGYTQPIVSWQVNGHYEVVDGFHRNRVGKESKKVQERVKGYLPLTIVNSDREERGDRISATIRHNRARGKHRIDAMAEIVLELKRRNWTDNKISNELGMDPDEILRLTQITGLAEMFMDEQFSEAWEAAEINDEDTLDVNEEMGGENGGREGIPQGWEDRTDTRSVLIGEAGVTLARLNHASEDAQWRWTVYTAPMQEGFEDSREKAKWKVDSLISQ